MKPDVVKNFLLFPMQRHWLDFEPTLTRVKQDLNFVMGFIKKKNCDQYTMSPKEHFEQFTKMIVRFNTPKHTAITKHNKYHVYNI